ncbi:MAG: right-handed parallel beta-helix repeat-containing protein [Bacteroidota bacterium]|nr:right-handed parallel beta-helix repeat-containing protein [Bacteroidota bacterium]
MRISSSNIIKFNENVHLMVDGTLIADAGVGQNIFFTAYTDDTIGGDTNGDGNATNPVTRYWGSIQFRNSSIDTACIIRRANISYGGGNYWEENGGVNIDNASPIIDNCTFSNNFYGIMVTGISSPVIANNTINSSQRLPLVMSLTSNPVFNNNTFSFTGAIYNNAIGLFGGVIPAGAFIPVRSVTGISNLTYVLLQDVVVPPGRTLTIQKGVVLKGITHGNRLAVQGKLVANGSADSLIAITSIKDDTFGGDTNRDGTATTPVRTDWGGIIFEATSDTNSILNHCRLRFGQSHVGEGLITTVNASPTISNCIITDNVYGIYASQLSNPKILNTTITNSLYTPIAMSVCANPTLSGLTFINPAWTAIGIIGENLAINGTIKRRNVAGFNNITYLLLGHLTINTGVYVTVEPGVVVKMNDGVQVLVNGGFQAKGNIADGQIVFTGFRDDNVGNPFDTNNDGPATSPSRGNWGMIKFQASSDDAFCLLDSCQVKFADAYGWGAVSFTDANGKLLNSTITNSNHYGVRFDETSTTLVDNVSISDCRLDPFAMSLKSDPTLTNITFAGNGSQGIRILEGDLHTNALLKKRDVAGINNIAYIVHWLTIQPNAVLTLEPGVVMKFIDWSYGLYVYGALVANGTPTEKIVFTAIRDDSKGGDTNNDGSNSFPGRGHWLGVLFYNSIIDSLNSLKLCEIRYGGSGYGGYGNWGNVIVSNCRAKIDSCDIEHSNTSGLGIYGGAQPVITNTLINNVSHTPVFMSLFANPTFTNVTALNVGYMAIGLLPETFNTNASVVKRNLSGYTNISYMIYQGLTINTGVTITIPEGVVFKGGVMQVNGGLVVNGTSGQPVVFTSVADDSYGNPLDTEGNGFQTPVIEGLSRIVFADASIDANCSLRNTIVRYADYGININQASPILSNVHFDKNNGGIYMSGVSQPVVDSCVFHNLTYSPLISSLVSYPSSTIGNSISGSTWRGVRIIDETLSQNLTLPIRTFGGVKNIPYIFGSYTVGSGAVLTIEPGVILKFVQNGSMVVRKGLIAEGGSTSDSTIVFTSLLDDFYGGDTNADSNRTSPWVEYWGSVRFEDESNDPLCRIRNGVFRFGGHSALGRGAIYTNNASPIITRSAFMQNRNALYAVGSSNPVINYCDIYQSTEMGIFNQNKVFNIDARNNWWGDNSGPAHASNPGGVGNGVTDSVNFMPYRTIGSLKPKAGDVSLNGVIQAYDASLVLKFVVDSVAFPLNAIQKQAADVSGEMGITSFDASLILQYVVGKITSFPVENLGKKLPVILPKLTVSEIKLGSAILNGGTSMTLPIQFSNVTNLASIDLSLQFDTQLFTLKNTETTSLLSGMTLNQKSSAGEINVAIAGSEYIKADGNVLLLTFDINKDIKGSLKSSFEFTRVLLNETDFTALAKADEIMLSDIPIEFSLNQNYPNPFNPSTTIRYQIPGDGQVNITVYDVVGKLVTTLVDEQKDAGSYSVVWNGRNDAGVEVGNGMFFYKITVKGKTNFTDVKKMLLTK